MEDDVIVDQCSFSQKRIHAFYGYDYKIRLFCF